MNKRFPIFAFLAMFFVFSFTATVFAGLSFEGGFSERLRHEFRKNLTDLENKTKDNRNFFKVRTSLWGQADFTKNSNIYIKLTNENTAYTYWAGANAAAGKSAGKKGYHYDIDEVVFDNLYYDVKNFYGMPLDLRLGRQNFDDYAEGFLFKDGTPAADAARTYYFNGVKSTWHIDGKNTADFIFIKDDRIDDMLPIINRKKGGTTLTSSDETAYAFYHKNDTIKNLCLEDYYIFKRERAAGAGSAVRMTAEKTRLNTLGSFVRYKFSPWTSRSQLAYQFGTYGAADRKGLGGYTFLDRDFKNFAWAPQLSFGFIYLSGDDKSTAKNEAWDPLFSRWPWFSELYGLAYGSESEIYYWTNLQAYRIVLSLTPIQKIQLTFGYNFLRANEEVAQTAALFSGSGRNRGNLFQGRVDYKINKNITSYFTAEYFIPGNFYVKTADEAVFLRTDLQIKF